MKHWLRIHGLSFIATIKTMLNAPMTTILNIVVISLALSLPLGLFMMLSNTKALLDNMPIESQLTVFMHTDVSTQEKTALTTWLNQHPDIKTVRFISKDEGLKELATHSGLTDVLGGLSVNPLPDAFLITLKETSPQKLSQLGALLQEENGVESVLVDRAWAERLMGLFSVGDALLKVLLVILGLGVILITGNSIRMQILTRLKEIEVSKLIGASDAFIRRPFLYFAILQGLMGSLLAVCLVWIAFSFVNPSILSLAKLYNMHFALQGPSIEVALGVCLITAILCTIGASFSVYRHIRRFN